MKSTTKMNVFFIIIPFIDLITALMTRYTTLPITLGIIIKSIFLLFLVIYILKSKSKYHKISIILLAFIIMYIFGYFIFKPNILNTKYLITELQFIFKLIYFPLAFVGLLCFWGDNNYTKIEIAKILKVTLIAYILLLLIPILFNSAYTTYPKHLKGYIGWFYAGNEIANIMILLFPFSYLFISEKKYSFLIILPIIYTIFSIGTKVSTLGIVIISLITFVFSIIKNKFKFKKNQVITLSILFLSVFYAINSYAAYNYKFNLEFNYQEEKEEIIIEEENIDKVNNIKFEINNLLNNRLFRAMLSGRDMLLANTISVYNEIENDANIIFGIGFSNTEQINNKNISRLIEIDIFDGYFHFGIMGLLIMLSPIFLSIYLIITSKNKITLNAVYLALIIMLILGISCLSGHVFLAPAVSIYYVLILLLFLNEFKLIGRQENLTNKIAILSLHLGYGGIEKSIVDQANMISEKYPVEIITLYNTIENIPYKVNKKVKIIYLSNLKPNKKEFLEKIHFHKYLSAFKEGLRSIYILYQKKNLVANYIYNSDAKIIISTRNDFTKILNKYANPQTITIAEEHVYHQNNKKYIKSVEKNIKNINYLIPASEYLAKDYQKILSKKLTTVKYIPQTLTSLPTTLNKCQNKNIITVSRLSKEKGLEDLIKTLKTVIQKDNEIKLTIVGDGEEKENLENLAKKLKIAQNITFTGYLNQSELQKEYEKASLFVMTSHEESFGLVLLEAMSYNIPCFAFDSAKGAVEQINPQNGKLISNRDANALAKEILNYFENSNQEYSPTATISQYLPSNVKKMWHSFIKEILEKEKEPKIIFISSMGGHFNELLHLTPTMQRYNSYIITEKSNVKASRKIFYLMAVSRYEKKYILGIIYNTIKSINLFLKINPDFIISTGSHTAVAMCYIAKIFGKKVIYIESFANINQKSLAGKLVYPISDVFIVQWQEMQKIYPKAKYWGCLY